jgi:hypothetical protein
MFAVLWCWCFVASIYRFSPGECWKRSSTSSMWKWRTRTQAIRHSIQSPPASAQRLHLSYSDLNALESACSRIAFSSPVSLLERWNGLEHRPFHCTFNSGYNKSRRALNHGSRVDGIRRGFLVLPKSRGQSPSKNMLVHRRAEDTRTHLPETGA